MVEEVSGAVVVVMLDNDIPTARHLMSAINLWTMGQLRRSSTNPSGGANRDGSCITLTAAYRGTPLAATVWTAQTMPPTPTDTGV